MKENYPVLSGFEFTQLLEGHHMGDTDPLLRYDYFDHAASRIGATALLSMAGARAASEGRLTGDQLLDAASRKPKEFEAVKMMSLHHGIDTLMRSLNGEMGAWQSTDAQGLAYHFINPEERLAKELAFVRPRAGIVGRTAIVLDRFTAHTEYTLLQQARQMPHPGVYGRRASTRPPRASRG